MATTKATTTDAEAAAAAGVAVPPASYDEYAEKVTVATAIDSGDTATGWTAQSKRSLVLPEDVPGQRFHPSQLPDPSVAIAAGIRPQAIPEHLVTEDDDDPQGPEPGDLATLDARQAIRDRIVADSSAAADEAAKAKAEDEKAANAAPKKAAETKAS